MKRPSAFPADNTTTARRKAFTLVEVMIAATVFCMCSLGLTGLLIQNARLAKWQTLNVRATNAAFGILDQLKNMGAEKIWEAYNDPTKTLTVLTIDPSDQNDGYKELTLKINQTGVTEHDKTWAKVTLKLGRGAKSPEIPMSFWVSINRNVSAVNVTPSHDLLELTLYYRWSVAGFASTSLAQLPVTFPAPNGSFK